MCLEDLVADIQRFVSDFYGGVKQHFVPAGKKVDGLCHRCAFQTVGVDFDAGEAFALLLVIGAEEAAHACYLFAFEVSYERV